MRAFLKRIGYFIIFSLALVFLVQLLVSMRIRGRSVSGYDNLEQTAGLNADLVLIGSSRCWAHFDPHFFENTYNLKTVNIGMDGHTEIQSTMVRLRNYLSKNSPPHYAILNLDPFVEAGSFAHNVNFVHKNYYARYCFFPDQKNAEFVDYFGFNRAERYVPLYALFKYKLFFNSLTLKNESNYLNFGYENHEEHWDTVANPVNGVLKHKFITKNKVPALEAAMRQLLALCHAHNIKLMCIQTPVYRSVYDPAAFSGPADLCAKLGIPYLDANSADLRANISYFYNSNHLNRAGVEQLNAIIKKDSVVRRFFAR